MPDIDLHATPPLANGCVKAKALHVGGDARKLHASAPDLFQCTEARNPTRLNPTPKKRARGKNAARAIPVEASHRRVGCRTLAINNEMRAARCCQCRFEREARAACPNAERISYGPSRSHQRVMG